MKRLKNTLKKVSEIALSAYVGTMIFTMEAAAQLNVSGKLSDNAVNTTEELKIFGNQILFWGFFGGLVLGLAGIGFLYRAINDQQDRYSYTKPGAAIFVGICLMLAPEILGDGIGSIFGDDAQQGADADIF